MEAMATNNLLLRFQSGPLVNLQISGGALSSTPGALGPVEITSSYLTNNQYNQVLLFLNQLDWSSQGQTILTCINMTFNRLVRSFIANPTRETEALMEMSLGLFYAPARPIPEDVAEEFSEQIHDLTRRFFHQLTRQGQLSKGKR